MDCQKYLDALHREIKPALGCTEPIAVALAVAKATETLGCRPEKIALWVSTNILKNAMGVGIPGTGMVGLEIASALSCIAGRSAYGLEVLSAATPEDCEAARVYAATGCIQVHTKDTEKKLYIEAHTYANGHEAVCVIEDAHTNVTHVQLDDQVLEHQETQTLHPGASMGDDLDVVGIYAFATTVDLNCVRFLNDAIAMNDTIAQEGLSKNYGMRVGRVLQQGRSMEEMSLSEYVCAYTAAAADARMAGSTLPVMSTTGSGNQGISASLPVVAAARKLGSDEDTMLRAETLSQLITIHIKSHIGKLSPLCGCAIAASIGSSAGIVYLLGGGINEILSAIQNMIADVSGLICDGAKSSCAAKISTALQTALLGMKMGLHNCSFQPGEGMVHDDIEETIAAVGRMGRVGMKSTDIEILNIMLGN